MSPAPYDVFLSLRFGETGAEAWQLKQGLEDAGLTVFISDVSAGISLHQTISEALTGCRLAVLLASATYGRATTCFSTREELGCVLDSNKPFYLIKMAEMWEEPVVRMAFSDQIMFKCWKPGTPMPEDLVQGIVNTLAGRPPPPPAPTEHLAFRKAEPPPPTYDVFFSFRYRDSETETTELARQLRSHGLKVHAPPYDDLPGENWVNKYTAALEGSRLVIMMASETYGQRGAIGGHFTTLAHMMYVLGVRKPFFLVRMIPWDADFKEASTRLVLTNELVAVPWLPGTPMPVELVELVMKALDRHGGPPLTCATDASGEGSHSDGVVSAKQLKSPTPLADVLLKLAPFCALAASLLVYCLYLPLSIEKARGVGACQWWCAWC